MARKYDFSGWATWNNALCADGRVIKHNAFKDNDGAIVPLVYMHGHKTPEDIIGNVLLENRDEGVYCYGSFNNNPQAIAAKEAVMHGDIDHLSIYANHLRHQNNNEVVHGDIKEVSLVIAGANPGAIIDYVDLSHDEDGESTAIIYTDYVLSNAPGEINLTISHADDDKKEEEKKEEAKEEKKEEAPAEEEKKEEPKAEEKKEESKAEEKKEEAPAEEKKEEAKEDKKEEAPAEEKKEEPKAEGEAESKSEGSLEHADSDKSVEDVWNSFSDEQKDAVYAIVAIASASEKDLDELMQYDFAEESEALSHADSEGKTVKQVWDTLSEEQQRVAAFIIADTLQNLNSKVEHSDIEGGNEMSRNLFENNNEEQQENVLSHDDMVAILSDIKTAGSLRNSVLQHGITNLEVMFPDAQAANDGSPIMYQRDQEWVNVVLNGVSKSPFARIKCIYADITGADARAKGFLGATNHKDANGKPYRDSKGNIVDANGNRVYKEEELFPLTKRTVEPTTVYKKQRLDRNDIVDITDFDVVVWLKAEMKVMLNEEVARAILIGDGRAVSNPDKIDESKIKPIWTDDDFYTIKAPVTVTSTDTDDTVAAKLIDAAVLAKKDYKGSGATIFLANEDFLTRMLLLKDTMGHRLYNTEAELASAMRVSKIVSVPVFQGATRVDADEKTRTLVGLIINLKDYRVGTDKKGAVTMFDDFDIDYNQEKYLIETRLSGMMVMPKAAIALETVPEGNG